MRGEDSLVRALWAAKPFVWQLYPQSDDAHHTKLSAFLDWLQAPPSWRQFHQAWNGVANGALQLEFPEWEACAQAARRRLCAQPDLVSELLRLVRQNDRGEAA